MLTEEPDYQREKVGFFEWNPGKKLIKAFRAYQKVKNSKLIILRILRPLFVIRYRFWQVVSGSDIPLNTELGIGLLLPHPNGIVLHPDVVIGANCLIMQQVTIGIREGGGGVPRIGLHVDIGAGAKIFGNIQIGDYAVIGANAVVLKDVPPYAVVAGVPGRVIKIKDGK